MENLCDLLGGAFRNPSHHVVARIIIPSSSFILIESFSNWGLGHITPVGNIYQFFTRFSIICYGMDVSLGL